MLINWFTVVAQAINFLILVWLLKRFLYKPILHAIDEREKGIASPARGGRGEEGGSAKGARRLSAQERGLRPGACGALEKSHGRGQRRTSAAARRSTKGCRRLACQTPGGVANRTTEPESRHHPLDPEGSLCHHAKDAGGPRHHEPRGTHGRRVRPSACVRLTRGQGAVGGRPQDASNPAVSVRSAFDLPPAQRQARSKGRSKETFSPERSCQFETAPELVSGIELSTNGQKVAWSIADYLATLEKSAGELLHQDAKPEAKNRAEGRSQARAKTRAEQWRSPARAKTKPSHEPSRNRCRGPKADH